jgi:tyrosinase
MGIRKDLTTLSSDEKQQFVVAVLELKHRGIYDRYVEMHDNAMNKPVTTSPEIPHPGIRNAAHRGPAFLPWHREFLRRFEQELQKINPDVTIPYWDWTVDATLDDPTQAPVWDDNFMGGNGDPDNDWRVQTGPFAYTTGDWPIREDLDGLALRRQLGRFTTLPTAEHVQLAMNQIFYDLPPWDSSRFTLGFRNYLEGWVQSDGDSGFPDTGSQLHNRGHVWVGGHMLLSTSPNDPIFFLHHCFVDKIWADWQARANSQDGTPELIPNYFPTTDGPPGHNLYDPMYPWDVNTTIASVLNNDALNIQYEEKEGAPQRFVPTETAIETAGRSTIIPDSPFAR